MQFLLNFLLPVCFYSISVKTKSTHLQKHISVQTVSAGNSYSSGENWDWREEGGTYSASLLKEGRQHKSKRCLAILGLCHQLG